MKLFAQGDFTPMISVPSDVGSPGAVTALGIFSMRSPCLPEKSPLTKQSLGEAHGEACGEKAFKSPMPPGKRSA